MCHGVDSFASRPRSNASRSSSGSSDNRRPSAPGLCRAPPRRGSLPRRRVAEAHPTTPPRSVRRHRVQDTPIRVHAISRAATRPRRPSHSRRRGPSPTEGPRGPMLRGGAETRPRTHRRTGYRSTRARDGPADSAHLPASLPARRRFRHPTDRRDGRNRRARARGPRRAPSAEQRPALARAGVRRRRHRTSRRAWHRPTVRASRRSSVGSASGVRA